MGGGGGGEGGRKRRSGRGEGASVHTKSSCKPMQPVQRGDMNPAIASPPPTAHGMGIKASRA